MTEANKVSTDRLKDKINVVRPYSGLLLSLKREGNPDTSYNIEVIMLNEISQSQKGAYWQFRVYEVCREWLQRQGVEQWLPLVGEKQSTVSG